MDNYDSPECRCHGNVIWPWWGTISEEQQKMFRLTPSYCMLYHYIQSGGQEEMLYCSLFKYIVQRWKGTLKECDKFYDLVASTSIWNLESNLGKDGDDHHDPIQLAQDLIDRDGFKGKTKSGEAMRDDQGRTLDCVYHWKHQQWNYRGTNYVSDDDLSE